MNGFSKEMFKLILFLLILLKDKMLAHQRLMIMIAILSFHLLSKFMLVLLLPRFVLTMFLWKQM